jgi:hypothetical protein
MCLNPVISLLKNPVSFQLDDTSVRSFQVNWLFIPWGLSPFFTGGQLLRARLFISSELIKINYSRFYLRLA